LDRDEAWIEKKPYYNRIVDVRIECGFIISDLGEGHYEFTRDKKLRKISGE